MSNVSHDYQDDRLKVFNKSFESTKLSDRTPGTRDPY